MRARIESVITRVTEQINKMTEQRAKVMKEQKQVSGDLNNAFIDGNKDLIQTYQEQYDELVEQTEKFDYAIDKAKEIDIRLGEAISLDDSIKYSAGADEKAIVAKIKQILKQAESNLKYVQEAESSAIHSVEISKAIKRQLSEYSVYLSRKFGKNHPFFAISMIAKEKELKNKVATKFSLIDEIEENAAAFAEVYQDKEQFALYLDTMDDMILSTYNNLDKGDLIDSQSALAVNSEDSLKRVRELQQKEVAARGKVERSKLRSAWKKELKIWVKLITELADMRGDCDGHNREILDNIKQMLEDRNQYEKQRSSYVAKCTSYKAVIARLLKRIMNVDFMDDEKNSHDTIVQNIDNYYDPNIFNECLEAVVRDYTDLEFEPDAATGERMQFYKRFNIYYYRKQPARRIVGIEDSCYGDPKVREGAMRSALNDILIVNGIPKVDSSFPIFNEEKIKEYLVKHGAGPEISKLVKDVFEGLFVERLEYENSDGEFEVNPDVLATWRDKAAREEEHKFASEYLIEFVEFLCETKLPNVSNKLAEDIRLWISKKYLEMLYGNKKVKPETLKALEEHADGPFVKMFAGYPDKDVKGKTDPIITAMGIFVNKKRETMRKRMAFMDHNYIPSVAREYRNQCV